MYKNRWKMAMFQTKSKEKKINFYIQECSHMYFSFLFLDKTYKIDFYGLTVSCAIISNQRADQLSKYRKENNKKINGFERK